MGETLPKTFPSHLGTGPLSNIPMPGPIALSHHPKRQLDRFTHYRTTTPQSLHWLQWHALYALQNCPFPGTIASPNYLPHPWIQPTRHPKLDPDSICRFSTIHQTMVMKYINRLNRTLTDQQVQATKTVRNTRSRSINDRDAANINNNVRRV